MSEIYAIGSNGAGQLGIGHTEDVSVPKPTIFGSETPALVNDVHAGGNHTLILSEGRLYTAGDGVSGARGIIEKSTANQHKFCSLDTSDFPDLSNIELCAATWEASILVCKDAQSQATKVYTLGIGNKGELGHGELLFRSAKPSLMKDFPPPNLHVVDIAACLGHVVAVLSNGDVYGWGNGRKGQVGEPHEVVHNPRKISGVHFPVTKAVCGREFTYLVGSPDEGQHMILGSDKWDIRSSAPSSVPGWTQIGAGWGNILVLLGDGKVRSWGRNDHGQCAPADIPTLNAIAVGSEHSLALTQDGDVLAWGWGEHGNCGPSTTGGDVKGRWNVIASSKYLSPGSRIYKVGAGCATGWMFVSG